jgi:hypothetical protein
MKDRTRNAKFSCARLRTSDTGHHLMGFVLPLLLHTDADACTIVRVCACIFPQSSMHTSIDINEHACVHTHTHTPAHLLTLTHISLTLSHKDSNLTHKSLSHRNSKRIKRLSINHLFIIDNV